MVRHVSSHKVQGSASSLATGSLLHAASFAKSLENASQGDGITLHAGLLPDVLTFNVLLGAYAKAKDVDGAYEAWCRMRQQGIVPDRITVVRPSSGSTLPLVKCGVPVPGACATGSDSCIVTMRSACWRTHSAGTWLLPQSSSGRPTACRQSRCGQHCRRYHAQHHACDAARKA